MTFVLGPALCKTCGGHVYWNGFEWCAKSGMKHKCFDWPGGRALRLLLGVPSTLRRVA